MTVLVYTYTDWQAKTVERLRRSLKDDGETVFWIGRRSPGLDSAGIRGVPRKNPFHEQMPLEGDGALPVLDDPVGFERDFLAAYTYQMNRYSSGYASRSHDLEFFHEYRDHFHLTARKFKRMIQREAITSLLFFNMPHTGDDYLLYRVAENMGLRVTFLMVSPFENRFFSTRSIESFGRLNTHGPVSPGPDIKLEMLDRQVTATVQSYMWGTRRIEKWKAGEVAFACLTLLRRSPRVFLQSDKLLVRLGEVIRLQRSLKSRSRTRREIRFGKKTRKFLDWIAGLEKNLDALPDRFVYVPLHFQPELTTAPQGGVFGDQALAIEMLAAQLPDGVEIVAKENPMQGGFHREVTFTDRLRQTQGITVVHPSVNSRDLEARCIAVATVTGTAGWEAIRDERPCICFGHAWYLDCPGVHPFQDNIDLEGVIADSPKHESTEAFLREIMARSHEGVVYEFFLKDDDPEYEARNFEHLNGILKGLLLGEIEPTFA